MIEGTCLATLSIHQNPRSSGSAPAPTPPRRGVWFTANALDATWVIATSVPAEILILPSSALYITRPLSTFGGATDRYVYVGTPGYLGTVVDTDGVVVYGTGYNYRPGWGDVALRRTGSLRHPGPAGL